VLLPLTFGLDPTGAIIMLAAVYYGAMYGGTITSVLINTPGESATVASTFDGYPLARQGRAGPALVVAAVASFVAGTVGALLISIAAPVTAAVASTFGPPELFLVVVAGLLTLIVIIGRNRLLGALSAVIGFALATVGIDIGGGAQRYTFGSTELINGIDFIPVAIGLFGVGEILHTLWRGGHLERIGYFAVRGRDFWPNREDVRESRGPILRGSLLGFAVGTAPGAGATVASLMSYNLEKSISRRPERFGKGAMAGLAGPEAANNAASAGAMVPLLTLGIPRSAGPHRQHVPGQRDVAAGQPVLHPGLRAHRPRPVPGAGPGDHPALRRRDVLGERQHRRGRDHAGLRRARILHAPVRYVARGAGDRAGARAARRGDPAPDDDHLRWRLHDLPTPHDEPGTPDSDVGAGTAPPHPKGDQNRHYGAIVLFGDALDSSTAP